MNIYYRFIRNNQDYKQTLSIFYKRGYHWYWSSLTTNIDNVKNSYIFGVDSYLRYGCHGCKLNDFKKTILGYFNIHSANFINLKINSVLELG